MNINYINNVEVLEAWVSGVADDSPRYNFLAEGEFSIIALREEDDFSFGFDPDDY